MYASAGSTLSNTAVDIAKMADQWWPSDLQHRYTLYCQRALATIHYAQLAAAKLTDAKERSNTLAFLEEQKGTLFLEQVQNAPPLYNQMHNSPKSVDPQYRQKCAAGLEAFQRAQLTLNEEWEFQLCIAKFLRKLGGSDKQVLHHLGKACQLAKEFADGTVESMYQLHATRLKLLQQPQPSLALLQRHCFLPETRAQLASTTGRNQSSQDQSALGAEAAQSTAAGNVEMTDEGRLALIFEDAMSAMEYCLEQSKPSRGGQHETFHKARYRRAQALFWQGKPGPALAELQPCFKIRSRHGFAINMFLIPEGVKRATKVTRPGSHPANDSMKQNCLCVNASVARFSCVLQGPPSMHTAISDRRYAVQCPVSWYSAKTVVLSDSCNDSLTIALLCQPMSRCC